MRAVVVFCDVDAKWWLRPLKRGFRHVSVAVEVGCQQWVVVNAFSNFTLLSLSSMLDGVDYLLPLSAAHPAPQLSAVETMVRAAPEVLAPIRPYTCVEEAKRLLGLHLPWVFTPWQLYRYLLRHGAKEIL